MSVTVTLVPSLLIFAIQVASTAAAAGTIKEMGTLKNQLKYKQAISNETLESLKTGVLDCNSIKKLEEETFMTQFVDKKTLIKTLKEHGAQNLYEENLTVKCDCEGFYLTFSKDKIEDAYNLNIKYSPEKSPEILNKDLSDEYNKNVQEISYNKIKERLEEKNLQINDEEILEDDTIVLTINLE